jgi:hypothetical protein
MDTGLVDWRCVLPLIIDGLLCVKCVQFYHRSAKVFCGLNANGDNDDDDEDSSEYVSGLFNVKSSNFHKQLWVRGSSHFGPSIDSLSANRTTGRFSRPWILYQTYKFCEP